MALATDQIRAAESDAVLFELLCSELDQRLPKGFREDWDSYAPRLEQLPQGLRAMAGIYFFNVSMAMDDLAWHFINQNDERELSETLAGLRELEMFEIADCFEKMWTFFKPHLRELQARDFAGKELHEWLKGIGAQELANPMNRTIWDYCKKHREHRLLTGWLTYARKYPERCVSVEAQA